MMTGSVLMLLSRSDDPLSEVLDRDDPAGIE